MFSGDSPYHLLHYARYGKLHIRSVRSLFLTPTWDSHVCDCVVVFVMVDCGIASGDCW